MSKKKAVKVKREMVDITSPEMAAKLNKAKRFWLEAHQDETSAPNPTVVGDALDKLIAFYEQRRIK